LEAGSENGQQFTRIVDKWQREGDVVGRGVLRFAAAYIPQSDERILSPNSAKNALQFPCLLLLACSCAGTDAVSVPERTADFIAAYREGLDLLERYRLPGAERAFARCVALAPEAHEGHWQLGRLRLLQGRIDEGVASLQHALELEPGLKAACALVLETFLGRGREALEEDCRHKRAVPHPVPCGCSRWQDWESGGPSRRSPYSSCQPA
jgi:hypothetical protein